MPDWNFADVYEVVAATQPDAPCHIQGDRVVTWAEFDSRANGLAAGLLDAGLGHQAKVAAYLYNCPEYLETYFACFKAGLVPFNTNYRYGPDEIAYLFDNADAEAVVFHAEFAPLIEEVRGRLPKVRHWYVVADGNPEPDWASSYEALAGPGGERVVGPWGRSGDDLVLIYTGGTTGLPKGVMWRQDDLFLVLGGGANALFGGVPVASLEELAAGLTAPGPRVMVACPLMHGTGQFASLIAMWIAGCIVTLVNRHFDPVEVWRTLAEQGVNAVVIVGDAFARPMLEELERNPDAYDLSQLLAIASSGVMWSQDVKDGLLRLRPSLVLFDSLGSSEAIGIGTSMAVQGVEAETARFQLGEHVRVFTDDGRPVEPGSDEVGFVAIAGHVPLGYYKDPAKSEATFRTIDGVRYSIPGDYAMVNADGRLHLLGRGSVCINTGGEKVFPEEVEEALKEHESVRDAVCVGVPDKRFGQVVVAVVEPEPGREVSAPDLIDHVKGRLAGFKAPRQVITVPSIGRSPSGKADYLALQALARERLPVV